MLKAIETYIPENGEETLSTQNFYIQKNFKNPEGKVYMLE